MSYYQYSIVVTDRTKHIGIRQLLTRDIDQVWREYERQAQRRYGAKLHNFSVVMLSKLSPGSKKMDRTLGKLSRFRKAPGTIKFNRREVE